MLSYFVFKALSFSFRTARYLLLILNGIHLKLRKNQVILSLDQNCSNHATSNIALKFSVKYNFFLQKVQHIFMGHKIHSKLHFFLLKCLVIEKVIDEVLRK